MYQSLRLSCLFTFLKPETTSPRPEALVGSYFPSSCWLLVPCARIRALAGGQASPLFSSQRMEIFKQPCRLTLPFLAIQDFSTHCALRTELRLHLPTMWLFLLALCQLLTGTAALQPVALRSTALTPFQGRWQENADASPSKLSFAHRRTSTTSSNETAQSSTPSSRSTGASRAHSSSRASQPSIRC
ncbi:hypothetical protein ASPSYDRAFT_382788 [Aspergillus sydowii CBS 593.65]|uniref:Uncharacterized protein n=1 Tax=Aspergillus sydowii CBS 593.65 TaxID=1036612 RepID=A0A1L9U140_9EURO|nr:uncharacterized protein ASPSYDRAFT_382788 [Aspergillus sydowii CBS 593.65]OJJ65404.1 hypothetical protein ASPSYDRAFT_382788 [Aspergillus sydowii CBS 593.65]